MICPLPSNCSNSSNFTPWDHPTCYSSIWFPILQTMGFDTKTKSIVRDQMDFILRQRLRKKTFMGEKSCGRSQFYIQNQQYNFTPLRHPQPHTAPPPCSCHSVWSEAPENGPKWFTIAKPVGFNTKIKSSNNWNSGKQVQRMDIFFGGMNALKCMYEFMELKWWILKRLGQSWRDNAICGTAPWTHSP